LYRPLPSSRSARARAVDAPAAGNVNVTFPEHVLFDLHVIWMLAAPFETAADRPTPTGAVWTFARTVTLKDPELVLPAWSVAVQ
jgi:hypothetical protein